MKIAIIGCGNMGGAIARAFAGSETVMKSHSLAVANRSEAKLRALRSAFPQVEVSTDNREAVEGAGMVIIAVKPWLFDAVAEEIKPAMRQEATIVSVAAGITLSRMEETFGFAGGSPALFRLIPNTAITVGESMTAIAHRNASAETAAAVAALFGEAGETVVVEERLMEAATSLGSCGTAFAMRYIRAAMEAGVEMGLYPEQARQIAAQTVKGAAELLLKGSLHPEEEIDKVTTPGGITIKGLNRMEACGFSNAVIEGHKAAAK